MGSFSFGTAFFRKEWVWNWENFECGFTALNESTKMCRQIGKVVRDLQGSR